MAFVVLEGFSGTGKTTIANMFEKKNWLHITESAHAIANEIPVADRGNVYSDYSLIGATLRTSGIIAGNRRKRNIVSEGYFISDLAYAMIRQKQGLSEAASEFFPIVGHVIKKKKLQPDLYVLLTASDRSILKRQKLKSDRDRLTNKFFRDNFNTIIMDLHQLFGHKNIVIVSTDKGRDATYRQIVDIMQKRRLRVF